MSFLKLSPMAILAVAVVGSPLLGASPAQATTTVSTSQGFLTTVTRPQQPTPSLPMRRPPVRR
jgi:hypothetical protein